MISSFFFPHFLENESKKKKMRKMFFKKNLGCFKKSFPIKDIYSKKALMNILTKSNIFKTNLEKNFFNHKLIIQPRFFSTEITNQPTQTKYGIFFLQNTLRKIIIPS